MLTPFVYWAQSETNIFLKIDLKNVNNPAITFEDRKLVFEAQGVGAQGLHAYKIFLEFSDDVSARDSTFKVSDNRVDILLLKREKGWWPRLTAQVQKPAWLKIDFDRWQSEDDINEESVRDIREDYPELYDKLQKEEMGYKKEDLLRVYLVLYNFTCFCGFLYIVSVLGVLVLKEGTTTLTGVYEAVGDAMQILVAIQNLEFIHATLGFTRGNLLATCMQLFGRNFILFALVAPEPRLHIHPVVFHLFLVWSAVEIIRYPNYILALYKKENVFLMWLRYTIWIPLYPIGFFCEAVIMYKSILYLDQNQRFSLTMPNAFNFTFSLAAFVRVYLLVFFLPGIYTLLSIMYKSRKQKLAKIKFL